MVGDKVLSKIYSILFMIIAFIIILPIGVHYIDYYWNGEVNYVTCPIIVSLAIMLAGIIVLGIVLFTLIPAKKHIEKLVRDPYGIEKIKLDVYDHHIKIFKDNTYFCTLRVRSLNPDNLILVVPLSTPLSFFNASSRRIVGDGSDIIKVRLPKAVWDVHTEFEKNKNSLIIQIDTENLKEKDEILSLVEHIKNKIEEMEYSDEHIRKIPNAQVAVNQFMKGHICVKCGNLIPLSKIKEKCPVDNKPHEIKFILLDTHVPYENRHRISYVIVAILILYIIIAASVLEKFVSKDISSLIVIFGSIPLTYILVHYFKNILTFKNMLKHFEAKKRYIFETLEKQEKSKPSSAAPRPRKSPE